MRKSGKTVPPLRADAEEEAVVRSASMTPLLPVRPRDVVWAIADMFGASAREPAPILEAAWRQARDQASIVLGLSDLSPDDNDLRFSDERWRLNPYFQRILQSWLALEKNTYHLLDTGARKDADTERTKFFLDIAISSLSPSNFPLTNPTVIDTTVEMRGHNILTGLKRLLDDAFNNHGIPTQVDKKRFKVGRDLAATPGQVVYRTDMFELLEYVPSTPKVHQLPLLLVASYINRHYLMDLGSGRSLVEYLVGQGHRVFTVVWRNPTVKNRDWGHDEYADAAVDTMRVVRGICGKSQLNVTGFCAGGTVTTLAASILEARDEPWINTLTLMVNVLDSRPEDTEMGSIFTEKAVNIAQRQVNQTGLFKAKDLLWSFNLMQPDSLIWSTAINYYLLNQEPGASKVMFWMNDQVNLPANLYCQQLDNLLNNPLPKPGAFKVLDIPVDLGRLTMPVYLVGAYYDHIMPWPAVYRTRNLLGGETEFVLTNGGHITPCITAEDNPRAYHYINGADTHDHETWLDGAEQQAGAWQVHWVKWLGQRSGRRVSAPKNPGNASFPPIDPAPGAYVHE